MHEFAILNAELIQNANDPDLVNPLSELVAKVPHFSSKLHGAIFNLPKGSQDNLRHRHRATL